MSGLTANGTVAASAPIAAYCHKEAAFKFRGRVFRFALSQGLFSSAGIDAGSRFLLRVFSKLLDEDCSRAAPLPRTVLDAGSGTGVLGICAAGTLSALVPGVNCRAQDRDELARSFTEYNARLNGVSPAALEAYAEPLLGGPAGSRWDLILSNIPAKTGDPVLLDFIFRSAALLRPGGRVLIVVVEPLAEFMRGRIAALGLSLLHEEAEGGHWVFGYGPVPEGNTGVFPLPQPVSGGERFFDRYPAYRRGSGAFLLEETPYTLEAIHGSAGFDSPGEAVKTAAKLFHRLRGRAVAEFTGTSAAALIHEGGQGHFAVWLAAYLCKSPFPALSVRWILSGRNILSLEAARHNVATALQAAGVDAPSIRSIPAIDPALSRDALAAGSDTGRYRFIAAFIEPVPQTDRFAAIWEGLEALLEPGGIVLVSLASTGAERFDRKKPRRFVRLGELKRKGFRAVSYERRTD